MTKQPFLSTDMTIAAFIYRVMILTSTIITKNIIYILRDDFCTHYAISFSSLA
ncbi:hypothetical protein KL86DYS1_10057 [uncultured Dysgonomonas sp.]|uniref:Uncharacterized protein n=1 Tax=uncultured Dysgonomonas sp. TaxID=206096 RepID=A0A212IT84_9BACT|nr:hypothetical protein KL86DYS1_10057 [uncultured Dysgonomonas sp.]